MNLRKILCTLSGDDYGIIKRCDAKIQKKFARIGLYVAAIFAVCAASSYSAFINLFPNRLIGVSIALFFAWMIFNIYLLLLYTLSKNVLPHKKGAKTRIISIVLRVIFICLIATVVSKPLEALIFSAALEAEIVDYKREKLAEYENANEKFYAGETEPLRRLIVSLEKLSGAENIEKAEKYRRIIAAKESEKNESFAAMRRLIENSNFYIYGIALLNRKYPICWFFTFFIISIFLIPAAIKNFISEKSDYYRIKRKIEMYLVREEYLEFKVGYRQILRENFGAEINFSEPFADAPFNTTLKIDRTQRLPESSLIAELYDA